MQNWLRNSTILLRLSLLLWRRVDLICNKVLVNETVSSPYLLQRIMQSVIPSWALSRTQNRSSLAFFSQPHCPLQSLSKNVYLFLCFYYSQKKDNNKREQKFIALFSLWVFIFNVEVQSLYSAYVCVSISLWVCMCLLSFNVLSKTCLYVYVCGSCCHVHVCTASVCFSLSFSRLCSLSNINTTLFIPYSVYRKCN